MELKTARIHLFGERLAIKDYPETYLQVDITTLKCKKLDCVLNCENRWSK